MSFKNIIFFLFSIFAYHSIAQNKPKNTRFINAAAYEKTFDLLHTKLDISFNISSEELYGKAWISLKSHFYESNKLVLDAKGMVIEKVALLEKELDYHYDGQKIYIDLDRFYNKEDSLSIFVKYTAQPAKVKQKGSTAITSARGLYFINSQGDLNTDKSTQIWTQGETEASSCWFPTIDKPNQKTSQEISITVPQKYTTLSNGRLISQTILEGGNRTDYWKMEQKHAPYLFFIGVGEFEIVKDSWRGKEVNYYVKKNYKTIAKKIFGRTPEMLSYFSEITGIDYVWDKYSQIVVQDFVSGAMENTTAVVYGEQAYQLEGDLIDMNNWEPVIAHELFHHWFGNLVTSENWSQISLNESFANYSEYLWILHAYGKDRADAHLNKAVETYKNGNHSKKHLVRYDYTDKEDVFDAVSYQKGGAILHMLKSYLGDKAFFAGINKYLSDNMFSSAEVPQLRIAFEEVSGKDLNWFFEQWYYGAGHPKVAVSKKYDLLEKTVTITLKQQSEVFYFPLLIAVHENEKIRHQEVFVDAAEKSFSFAYIQNPEWIQLNADHVVLVDFIENKTLKDYKYQYTHATHVVDRKEALIELVKHQENKDVFKIVVDAFDDSFYELQILALEHIDLSYKYSKHQVIEKIEKIAKTTENNLVKAAAIKVLGRLVNFDYQTLFEEAFKSKSNAVKRSALEAMYYLDKKLAVDKAKKIPNSIKKTIALPLSKIYIKERDSAEMAFVANYIMQGMYAIDDDETSKLYKEAFDWISMSNNIEAFENLIADMVKKGNQYRHYNFHLKIISMLREIVYKQEKLNRSNKKELIHIVNMGLKKLIG